MKPSEPPVAIVNSYQFEKFSLVTQPLHPSEISPGPVLKPLNEYPLLQIPVAFTQSALEVALGPVPEEGVTQEMFPTHPV